MGWKKKGLKHKLRYLFSSYYRFNCKAEKEGKTWKDFINWDEMTHSKRDDYDD